MGLQWGLDGGFIGFIGQNGTFRAKIQNWRGMFSSRVQNVTGPGAAGNERYALGDQYATGNASGWVMATLGAPMPDVVQTITGTITLVNTTNQTISFSALVRNIQITASEKEQGKWTVSFNWIKNGPQAVVWDTAL